MSRRKSLEVIASSRAIARHVVPQWERPGSAGCVGIGKELRLLGEWLMAQYENDWGFDLTDFDPRCNPDLYCLEYDHGALWWGEIVDTNPLSSQKIDELFYLSQVLGEWNWEMTIVVIDKYGVNTMLYDPLELWWYEGQYVKEWERQTGQKERKAG